MKPSKKSIWNLMQADNSNRTSPRRLAENSLAWVAVLAIIELVLFTSKIVGGISSKEYGWLSIGLPIIIIVWISPLLYKRQLPYDERKKQWYRIEQGLNAEHLPYLSIRGTLRNAIPAWLLSMLLIGLIVWRLYVDSIFVRKILCASFAGLISVVCFLIGVAICRMRMTITFRHDKFCIFRSCGLGRGIHKEFAYVEWCEIRPSQCQGHGLSVLTLVGVKGGYEALNCRVTNSQANEICAYVNEQISNHQFNHLEKDGDMNFPDSSEEEQ